MKPRPASIIPEGDYGVASYFYMVETGEWYGDWVKISDILTGGADQDEVVKECKRLLEEQSANKMLKILKQIPEGNEYRAFAEYACRHDTQNMAKYLIEYEVKVAPVSDTTES